MGKRASSVPAVRLGTPEFKKLKQEWDDKLAATGFMCLEYHRDEPDNRMRQHQLFDREQQIRGERDGDKGLMAAVDELRNHAGHSSLLSRICTGLYGHGMTKATIVAGVPKATASTVHRAVNMMRAAARRLVSSGVLAEDEYDATEENSAG